MEVVDIVPLDGAESNGRDSVVQVLAALAAAEQSPNASMKAIGQEFADGPGWEPSAIAAFSSARKWSGMSFGAEGDWVIGAPEVLLDGHADGAPTLAAAGERANQGLRVLLLARAAGPVDQPDDIRPVQPAGLVVLAQAVRPDSGATLDYFRQQGVTVKVISGDDPRTVGAIASRLGLDDADHPVDARTMPAHDLDQASTDEFAAIVAGNSVFGRVTPMQKRAMVGSLQAAGRTVAMTGDGVNDVLALKDADIGVAMGSGADATRSVAQLVLLENKFAVLPSVVAEGRKVIGNIERVAKLFLTKSVYGAVMAVTVGILQFPFPFLPRHLTVVTALTIGIPAFFLALAPNRDIVAPNMVARVLRFSAPAGVIAAIASFLAFWSGRVSTVTSLEQDRTTATITLFLVGMGALVAVARPLVHWKVLMIVLLNVAFVLAIVIPFTNDFFALETAGSLDIWLAVAIGLVGAAAVVVIGARTIPAQD
jgi:cation-transporting P-type ATPase E